MFNYQPKRGDIVVANGSSYGDPNRNHYGVIVSNDTINTYSTNVIVAWMTAGENRMDLNTHEKIYSSGKVATVHGELLQFIPKANIQKYVNTCTDIEMQRIERCIAEAVLRNV